jgi:hypothetical protein
MIPLCHNSALHKFPARVVKLVDAGDSKSPAARRAGSSPAPGTIQQTRMRTHGGFFVAGFVHSSPGSLGCNDAWRISTVTSTAATAEPVIQGEAAITCATPATASTLTCCT